MKSEGHSELDIIDAYLQEQDNPSGHAATSGDGYPTYRFALLPEPRVSKEQFDAHLLNASDLLNYPGPYNFELSVAEKVDWKRSKQYVYSAELNRLYSVLMEPVAFIVKTAPDLPPNCTMYVFPIYVDEHYRSENVTRCAYHSSEENSTANTVGENFFLRAGNGLEAEYMTIGRPNRDILVFPLLPNAATQVVPLRFMCRNSCQGAINRRATKLAMVLCNSSNDILGVGVIEFKVVSVPNRDSARDLQRKAGHPPKIRVVTKKPRSDTDGGSSDSEEYVIRIKGANNFRVLKAAAEGLELTRKLRKEKKSKYSENREVSPDLIL